MIPTTCSHCFYLFLYWEKLIHTLLQNETKLNGSVAGYTECPLQQQQQLSQSGKPEGSIKSHDLQTEHQVHQHHHPNVLTLSSVSPEKLHHHHPSTNLISSNSNTCLLNSSTGTNYCNYPSHPCSSASGILPMGMSVMSGGPGGGRPRGPSNPRMNGYEGLPQTEFELSDLVHPPHHPHSTHPSYQNPFSNPYPYHHHQSPHYVPHPTTLDCSSASPSEILRYDDLSSMPSNCYNPSPTNLILTSTSLPSPLPPASGPGVMGYGMTSTATATNTTPMGLPHIPVHSLSTLPPPPNFVNSQSTQTTSTTTRVLQHSPYYNYDYDCSDMSQF